MNGILLNTTTGDLAVHDGGLVLGDTAQQTVECVLRANRGEYREMPLVGAEVMKMHNGIASRIWAANAKRMCRLCGVAVSQIEVGENGITVK